jgi:response regulator RpfG family c-di-GMP phosphodiesterase
MIRAWKEQGEMSMEKERLYRVLIFDDDETIRKILWMFFDGRGYEIFTFPHPGACALCKADTCVCSVHEACADIIMSDFNMPFVKGMDFLEQQIHKGCKCKHFALMSGDLSDVNLDRAAALGIKLFNKPFSIAEIKAWVEKSEATLSKSNPLSNWFLNEKP